MAFRYLAILLGASGVSACQRASPPPTESADTVSGDREGIEISLDCNWQTEPIVYAGRPLLIRTAAYSRTGQPIKLATTAPWSQSVAIAVLDGERKTLSWPLRPTGTAPSTVELGDADRADATWVLDPEFTRSIAPGSYVIAATLDVRTTAVAGQWRGTATAAPLTLRVTKPPATPSPRDEAWKPLIDSAYAEANGDGAAALAVLDTALSEQPDSILLQTSKASLLDRLGRTREALTVTETALASAATNHPSPPEPAVTLLTLQRKLLNDFLQQK